MEELLNHKGERNALRKELDALKKEHEELKQKHEELLDTLLSLALSIED